MPATAALIICAAVSISKKSGVIFGVLDAVVDFLSPCHNISCERFESLSSRLHDRYGHVTCLAFFDIPHDSGFARMRAADDFALGAVLQFSTDMGFH
jgi:hypothetical protein